MAAMTREDKLFSMKGPELIKVADQLGVKVKCNKARTKLVEAKADLIERILAFEAAQETEPEVIPPNTLVETPAPENVVVYVETDEKEEVLNDDQSEVKKVKELKKPNLKIKEITYKGKTQSINAWADEIGMPRPTLYDRINRNGWTVEEAIEIPLGQRRKK